MDSGGRCDMRWTRRAFLEAGGVMAAAAGLGAVGMMMHGRVFFDEERALPGMRLRLTLEMDNPESKRVQIIARCDGYERVVQTMKGARQLEIEIPAIESDEESYLLYAMAGNGISDYVSEPVEVLSQPYHFGL